MDTAVWGWGLGALAVAFLATGSEAAYKSLNNLQMEIERGATAWYSRCFVWVTGQAGAFTAFLRLVQVASTALYIGIVWRLELHAAYVALALFGFVVLAWGAAGVLFRLYPLPLLKGMSLLWLPFYSALYPLCRWIGRRVLPAQTGRKTAEDYADEVVEESLNDLRENYDASPEYEAEGRMVQNVMALRKSKVRDCMVPAANIVRTSETVSIDGLVRLFTQSGFSKILIYKERPENIVGYVHAYDLFREPAPASTAEIIRPIDTVPETIAVGALLKEMIEHHRSIVTVFGLDGVVSGLLTLEDLMEEIFGEIEDEFDVAPGAIPSADRQRIPSGTVVNLNKKD